MKLEKDREHPNLYWNPKHGTYYFRKYVTGVGEIFRSLRERNRYKAVLAMNQILADLQSQRRGDRPDTIDEVVRDLYEIDQMKSQATFENRESFCRLHILPYFSGTPITEVAQEWDTFKAHVKKKNPGMSLRHVREHMVRILNFAVEQKRLSAFPKLKLDPGERMKPQPRAYSVKEVGQFFNGEIGPEFKFKRGTVERQRLMMRLTLEAGLRPPHEIRLLRKDCLDHEHRIISLPPEIVKTRTGRKVPISAELCEELIAWGERCPDSPWFFPMRGRPDLPASRSDKSFQRVKKALGFDGKRYWFRHTHGTAAIEAGQDALIVAKDMGTSAKMLTEVYVKPSPEVAEKRVSAVRAKFGLGGG